MYKKLKERNNEAMQNKEANYVKGRRHEQVDKNQENNGREESLPVGQVVVIVAGSLVRSALPSVKTASQTCVLNVCKVRVLQEIVF